MKFISVIALLAPAVLAAPAAPGDAWITLIKEQCPDMSGQCLDIAKKVHQPGFNLVEVPEATQAMPTCNPAYVQCAQTLASDAVDVPQSGATQGQLATCLLQIAPDHIKYFLDNDRASTPIPDTQNCPLRELHRVAHIELGPTA
ncbi:hypothetical protein BDV38DRAFT_281523 [Aspergillus pseudotamarii]|uniref:Secreted protein n=1 Tax=Aspergillus pseudotamarii TaxID=132259 RepID=A0A5N6SZU6_ASPPS|nr:uncharacterized protein BDV38DRAFT_281523 [Aspergillus pseudotamarii]KAE8138963.1 hypothetical protein BDV38DRAFT_281523 [Aspergillus pseudotamarii]